MLSWQSPFIANGKANVIESNAILFCPLFFISLNSYNTCRTIRVMLLLNENYA